MEEEIVRIAPDVLSADFSDGDILYNTDLNKIVSVVMAAINANYVDIKNSSKNLDNVLDQIKDAFLSKASETTLQNDDKMFPSSKQVKIYVDSTVPTLIAQNFTKITGYNGETTQVLKNINGVLTWVDEV